MQSTFTKSTSIMSDQIILEQTPSSKNTLNFLLWGTGVVNFKNNPDKSPMIINMTYDN